MDYAKLKAKDAELKAAHPEWTDQQICDEMNAVTMERNRPSLTSSEVFNAVDETELAELSPEDGVLFWNLMHMGTLNPHGREAAVLSTMFGPTSATITALKALRVEACSWAGSEGMGTVYPGHLENARMN